MLGVSLLSLCCADDGKNDPTPAPASSEPGTSTPSTPSDGPSEPSTPTPTTPPPTPPADDKPRVNFALSVEPGCDVAAGTYYYPARSDQPVSDTSRGVGFADGDMGGDGNPVSVNCTWASLAAPYTVVISLTSGPITEARLLSASLTVDPTKTEELSVLVASGTPFPPNGDYGPTQDTLCSFEVKELNAETRSVWGVVTCPAFGPTSEQDTCVIGPSYLSVANCQP